MAIGIRTIGELFGFQRKAKANAPITHRGSEPRRNRYITS